MYLYNGEAVVDDKFVILYSVGCFNIDALH